ncbi:unnamed protein product [Eruca vesicaria subsp. sativa]|uniref:Protein kinase domain-containing protein n=1 Tax=Eruca vesicaria subsp. sativa TaxID=29727 RepID=A0ABC8KRF3_ERUVS|nr:unnamed protein product [Eruca vesicaria subsp. sativa]
MATITLRVRNSNLMKHTKKKNRIISLKEISNLVKKPSSHNVTLEKGGRTNSSSSWVKSLLLGRGAYGSVYLGTSRSKTHPTGERAIKTAKLSHASTLMDEGRILVRLQSPFIVHCFGDEIAREEDNNCMQYNLILEYCSGRTIADLIEDNHGELLECEAKVFTRDVLSGLTYIHDRNIIHCDIKPDNLLLSPTDQRFRSTGYLTKIGDFGLAMEKGSLEYGNGYGHKRGTTRYMAPELIGHGVLDFGADVWALGCTVLEMLSGKTVWGEYGDLAFDDWVNLIGHSDRMPHVPAWLSKDALDFLSRCLERDINKRWSAHSLKNHPFVLL